MEKRGVVWFGVIIAIMLLCYIIPYTFLSGVDAWYGSFLFWTICTLAVIGMNVVASTAWRD